MSTALSVCTTSEPWIARAGKELIVKALQPWKTEEAKNSSLSYYEGRWVDLNFSTYDTQAQIELCLNCPFQDECIDCVSAESRIRKKGAR